MSLENLRRYGNQPYSTVLVHGGPGAPGEMRPVALELSKLVGVIEPFQTANSVQGQVDELIQTIKSDAIAPVVLIGWSWGAWLSYVVAARIPELIKKLIIVSSGPFEAKYTEGMMDVRLGRLTDQEKLKAKHILVLLQEGRASDKDFSEFGGLMDKADSYNPIAHNADTDIDSLRFDADIYDRVWPEADKMRKSGVLLEEGKTITCPVVAIHGDYDSHPAAGVKKPLEAVLSDFRFILLKNCGHHPWFEKEAKDIFYQILQREIYMVVLDREKI